MDVISGVGIVSSSLLLPLETRGFLATGGELMVHYVMLVYLLIVGFMHCCVVNFMATESY